MASEVPLGLRNLPVFIQQGAADRATKSEYLREFLDKSSTTLGPLKAPPLPLQKTDVQMTSGSGVGNVTYLEVPGGFHDLFHDTQTPICLSNIKEWLCREVRIQGRLYA